MTPRSGWCGWLLLTQVACASGNWVEPVGDFKKSVDESVAVVAGYYDNLNAFERRVYLADALADPTSASARPTLTANRPRSAGSFSARGIKARTDALALVSLYARRLADSRAPTRQPNSGRMSVCWVQTYEAGRHLQTAVERRRGARRQPGGRVRLTHRPARWTCGSDLS